MTLRSNPLAPRRISAKFVEKAEEGDLAAIREIADRLDGKPVPAIDIRDVPLRELTNAQLHVIAAGGLPERNEDETEVLLLPPGPKPQASYRSVFSS
jgi:hypothetical protein